MYTDKDYQVKDRFHENATSGSIRTLYRYSTGPIWNKESVADPGLYPSTSTSEIKTIPHCPPGLEMFASLSKLYLIRRLEIVQDDPLGKYKAEIVNEEGRRIFLITTSTHYDSNEVIQYGKMTKLKMKGKMCYGVINYAGLQVFEIYGDPEKVIRIGPNSAVWGEIQVIPGAFLNPLPLFYCCCCKQKREDLKKEEAEIRVIILKKEFGDKSGPYHQPPPSFKHVYTIKGKVYGGCCNPPDSVLYKKSFNLRIYSSDPFAATDGAPSASGRASRRLINDKKVSFKSIGRICSSDRHEKLDCDLPTLEMPQNMDIYDKITLMGMFFLFQLT